MKGNKYKYEQQNKRTTKKDRHSNKQETANDGFSAQHVGTQEQDMLVYAKYGNWYESAFVIKQPSIPCLLQSCRF